MVKDGDNWNATSYVITKAPVTITKPAVESAPVGIPAFAFGVWKNNSRSDSVYTQYYLKANHLKRLPATYISAIKKNGE